MATGLDPENWEDEAVERPAILIDGAHHARELTTISMVMYQILHIAFNYERNEKYTVNLLKNSVVFVIPVVNIDGF